VLCFCLLLDSLDCAKPCERLYMMCVGDIDFVSVSTIIRLFRKSVIFILMILFYGFQLGLNNVLTRDSFGF
jgi:hypothetical protein